MTSSVESATFQQAPAPRLILDAELHKDYHYLDPEEAIYQLISPSQEVLDAERQNFSKNPTTYSPDLRPKNLNLADLTDWDASLQALKTTVPDQLADPTLQNAYRWRINESSANLRLLEAAQRGEGRRFGVYNSFIYGKPEVSVFKAVSDWVCSDAERAMDSTRPEIKAAAENLLSILGEHRGDKSTLIPDKETFDAVRAEHYREKTGFIAVLLAGVDLPEDGMITAKEGDPAIRQMLKNIGSTQTIEDARSWSNSPAALRRPADYSMTRQEFIEFLVHELSHADEYINGEAGPFQLYKTGFDRYERGNEGTALLKEQVSNENLETFTDGSRWQEILGRHLAVSLGSGLTRKDGSGMSFAETYAVLNNMARLYEYTHSPASDVAQATERADNATWDLLVSVYKGTDGTGKHGVYRRPMIYLEGNLDAWKKAKKDPRSALEGRIGKTDITNKRHATIRRAVEHALAA